MESYDWANPTAKRQRVDAYAEHYQQAQHGADKAAQKQQSGCVAAWNRLRPWAARKEGTAALRVGTSSRSTR